MPETIQEFTKSFFDNPKIEKSNFLNSEKSKKKHTHKPIEETIIEISNYLKNHSPSTFTAIQENCKVNTRTLTLALEKSFSENWIKKDYISKRPIYSTKVVVSDTEPLLWFNVYCNPELTPQQKAELTYPFVKYCFAICATVKFLVYDTIPETDELLRTTFHQMIQGYTKKLNLNLYLSEKYGFKEELLKLFTTEFSSMTKIGETGTYKKTFELYLKNTANLKYGVILTPEIIQDLKKMGWNITESEVKEIIKMPKSNLPPRPFPSVSPRLQLKEIKRKNNDKANTLFQKANRLLQKTRVDLQNASSDEIEKEIKLEKEILPEAILQYSQAITLKKGNFDEARYNRAIALCELGSSLTSNPDKAIRCYEEALDELKNLKVPDRPEIKLLTSTLNGLKDATEAIKPALHDMENLRAQKQTQSNH